MESCVKTLLSLAEHGSVSKTKLFMEGIKQSDTDTAPRMPLGSSSLQALRRVRPSIMNWVMAGSSTLSPYIQTELARCQLRDAIHARYQLRTLWQIYQRMAAPCGIAETRVARRESGMVRVKTANCGIRWTVLHDPARPFQSFLNRNRVVQPGDSGEGCRS